MSTPAASKTVSVENILLATDFSRQSSQAVPFALSMAHKYGSKIFATHVLPPPPLGSLPTLEVRALSAQALREAREKIKVFGHALGSVPNEELLRKGEVWDELSTILDEKKIDLIVLGTHGRAGVSKLLIGSVAETILRQSPRPVLTVGPNVSAEPGSVADVHTILCPIDFTPDSLAALPYAISLAQENQARLYLMHVAPGPVSGPEEALLLNRLKELVPPQARLWCEPKVMLESGEPADRILEEAEELGIDVIVLGIRPVSTLAGTRTHLGMATAYRIVSRAICPVLSVRR